MITCYFEKSKKKTSLRHVVVDSLIIKDKKILLVKRSHQWLEPDKWALPGGFVERHETLYQAALREAEEETGYQIKIKSLLTVIDDPNRCLNDDRQNISFIYLAEPVKKVGQPDHEIKEVKWFDLNKLPPAKDMAFDHLKIIKLFLESDSGCSYRP